MCTFAHGYVCFLVNCKDNQKRADTNTSASPNLLMGLQCLADSNKNKCRNHTHNTANSHLNYLYVPAAWRTLCHVRLQPHGYTSPATLGFAKGKGVRGSTISPLRATLFISCLTARSTFPQETRKAAAFPVAKQIDFASWT